MAIVERENIGLLHDKLTVKIEKGDYFPAFEKKLKEYSKTANIPGFRKGMVPAGMIKKMYGAGIFQDEVLRTVEKELHVYLTKENPAIFAQPLPLENKSALDFNAPDVYDFSFEIGLKPEFTIADFATLALNLNKVDITDDMVNEEINRMQIKGGNMTEPETIDNPENVLNVLFTEIDEEGNAVVDGISKENSVLLKYFTPALQTELMGKQKGESVSFSLDKTFEGDQLGLMLQDLGFEKDDTEAAKKSFKLSIEKIGLIEKRTLTDDFFKEVFPGKEITSEEDFRANLKEDLKQYWDAQSRNQLHDQLYHSLLENTAMDFPETFLKRWLQTGGEQQKTAEQAEQEYPTFSNQLKWTLISDRLITENKLEVTDEALRESMRQEVMRYFGQMNIGEDLGWLDGYLDRMMKDEKHVDTSYRKLITEKIFGFMESQSKPTEKTVTAEALLAMQHNHAH